MAEYGRLTARLGVIADVVDGVSLDVRRLLSARELFGLFGLEAPAAARAGAGAGTAAD